MKKIVYHLINIPEYGTFEQRIKMGRNTSIILGEHFDEFIKAEIDSGRYGSVSEVIRSGLRLIEEESKKIKLINEALVVGEQSGESLEFDNEQFKARMRKKYASNA